MAALFGIVLCSACAACSKRADDTKSAGAAPVKPTGVSVTRSVSLPVQVITDPSKTSADPATLTISEADDDETAEGPSTFDVRPDKGFVVADPLRQRVVFYDAAGKYQQELLLSMAPQHVRVLPDNALSIVRYQTGQRYIYEMDAAGQYKAPRLATPSDPDLDAEDGGESNLNGPQSGIVRPLPRPGTEIAPVAIRFDRPGENMVFLRRLGADRGNHTYVLIEASAPSDTVAVETAVRKYTAGREAGEIADLNDDYLVNPEDAFRVRDGFVYQLVPRSTEVRINIWDTSSVP